MQNIAYIASAWLVRVSESTSNNCWPVVVNLKLVICQKLVISQKSNLKDEIYDTIVIIAS